MDRLASEGKTLSLIAVDGKLAGVVAAADTIKLNAKKAVERLLERLTNPGSWKPGRVLVPNELHVGNTTAQIKS